MSDPLADTSIVPTLVSTPEYEHARHAARLTVLAAADTHGWPEVDTETVLAALDLDPLRDTCSA